MKVFEIIYTYLIYSVPLVLALLVYYWLFRKASKVPSLAWKLITIVLIIAGIIYSLYDTIAGIKANVRDMNFPFAQIIVNAVAFALIAVLITAGTPEKEE